MGAFYWITGILLGIAIGAGLALRIVVALIMSSNDIGDSSGTTKDFGHGVTIGEKKNGLSRRKLESRLVTGRAFIKSRREAEVYLKQRQDRQM